MTVVNDIWRFLLQRKLWPVAILLVAAAVAVPKLLAKDPAVPAASPAAAVKSAESTLATEPIVALASDGDRAGRRRVLGSPKNPFKPNATPTPTPTAAPAPSSSQLPSPDTTSTTPGASTPVATPGSGSGAATPVTPGFTAPLVPATPKKTYELSELTVRFGASGANRPAHLDVPRLQALPSNDAPVLIYLGVLKDHTTAVFVVDSGIVAQGDGDCKPSRIACETIHLKEGETELLDVPADYSGVGASAGVAVQYQLDVIKLHTTTTSSAKKASESFARVSESGRKILRARIAAGGPLRYRYDQRTGRLEKLSQKIWEALVAKAARAARAGF
jgi:hypothetical protein